MAGAWPPRVGEARKLRGDITTLHAIGGPRPPLEIERMLGYRPGRLRGGYLIALLIEPLGADDFDFAGTTLRSGGRAGLPANDQVADKLRAHVSGSMRAEYGEAGYRQMKQRSASGATLRGPRRLAKVIPLDGIGADFSPSAEFPMGGGGLQWTIRVGCEKNFLIALHVTADLLARAPLLSVSLAPNQPFLLLYQHRETIARYLEAA